MLTSCVLSYASSYELFEVSLNKYEFVDNRITDAIIKWVINNDQDNSNRAYYTIRTWLNESNEIILEVTRCSGRFQYKNICEYFGYIEIDSKPFFIKRTNVKGLFKKALKMTPLEIECAGDGYISASDGIQYWVFRVRPDKIQLRGARLLW